MMVLLAGLTVQVKKKWLIVNWFYSVAVSCNPKRVQLDWMRRCAGTNSLMGIRLREINPTIR